MRSSAADLAEVESMIARGWAGDETVHLLAAYREAVAALERFVDGESCRYDHEGFCQAHGVSKPCWMVAARSVLGLPALAGAGERSGGEQNR